MYREHRGVQVLEWSTLTRLWRGVRVLEWSTLARLWRGVRVLEFRRISDSGHKSRPSLDRNHLGKSQNINRSLHRPFRNSPARMRIGRALPPGRRGLDTGAGGFR